MSFLSHWNTQPKRKPEVKTPGLGFSAVNLIADKLPSGSACFPL